MKKTRLQFGGPDQFVPIVFTDDGYGVCPVCAHAGGPRDIHPWAVLLNGVWVGAPSYDICPECQCHFGEDDLAGGSFENAWAVLRADYLKRVADSTAARQRIKENLGLDV